MKSKLSPIQWIETFIGLAMVALLAVIAASSHPDEELHTGYYLVLGVFLIAHTAAGGIHAFFGCSETHSTNQNPNQKDGDQ
jgi:hypothetical protein